MTGYYKEHLREGNIQKNCVYKWWNNFRIIFISVNLFQSFNHWQYKQYKYTNDQKLSHLKMEIKLFAFSFYFTQRPNFIRAGLVNK